MDSYAKPRLQGQRVLLRAPQTGDDVAYQKAGQHAEISKMYGVADAKTGPISDQRAERWFKNQLETPLAWVIEHAGCAIGALRFHSHDQADKRASFAIGLFCVDDLGKGFGTEAMTLAFRYGFEELKLHRIALRVLHFNARAIAAYEKLGFQVEGRERQSARIGDAWHDDIIMGLLAPDFIKKGSFTCL